MDIFKSLNDKQLDAVQNTEGYVRVIAGAGSGKTKLLVSRYAYLVKEYGINSANILCVTFTNKAAAEMRKRIMKIIGPEYSTSLICTYHGFCARLIRENPEKLFLTKEFQILDTYQQKIILEEIYQKYELKLDYASFQSMLKKVALKKQDLSYVPKMCSGKDVQILAEIETQDDKIIEEYLQRQKAIYSLDFTDLMSYALYLLENDDDIRTKWQERLNYIQVDEFQDSSALEMRLVDILSEKYQNLMIVGDPDQNIYEWRGSDVNLLVDFDKVHSDTKTIILNQNYRSTPQILKCANTLIEKNKIRLKKDLFTKNPDGLPVLHFHSKNEEDEVSVIVKHIKEIKRQLHKSYSDFAILYRSGFLSRVIERKLVEENVPYEIFGGTKFYQRMEILDIVAYLRLIAYNDDLSFKRIVNTPRRKFGRNRMAALEKIRESNEISLFENDLSSLSLYEILRGHLSHSAIRGSGGAEFVTFIDAMKDLKDKITISEFVNKVCVDSGYEQYIRELGDEERLDNLSELKRIANEFEKTYGERITLDEFLQQIALMSAEDADKPCEAVKLMTIHASKGLEFPVVFIIGFSEGTFPSLRSIEERKKLGLEEERRLCYVAITRAMERLYLLDNEGQNQNGMNRLPSRFIFEIGEENYQRIGRISDKLEKECFDYIHYLNTKLVEILPEPTSDKPQVVEHHIFGKGRVLSFDSTRKTYTIQFEKLAQPRSISAEYFSTQHTKLPLPESKENENNVDESIMTHLSQKLEQKEFSQQQTKQEKKFPVFFQANGEEIRMLWNSGDTFAARKPFVDYFHCTWDEATDYLKEFLEQNISESQAEKEEFADYEILPPDEEVDIEEFPIVIEEPEPQIIIKQKTEKSRNKTNDGEQTPDLKKISLELKKKLEAAPNHWNEPNFPQTGWVCTCVTDLGAPTGICEMCGYQIIRYVHHMYHPMAKITLGCGCVCAGKMEGDVGKAKRREQAFKNKQKRQVSFLKKHWKRSARGHEYLKMKEHVIVLFHFRDSNKWNFSIDGVYNKGSFATRSQTILAAFEAIDKMLYL